MSSLDVAIERYNELLANGYFESTERTLARASQNQNLVWLGRPLCSVFRPCFVPEPTLREARRAATLVARGLNTISHALLKRPDLRRNIGLTDVEEAAVHADAQRPREIAGRLDGFLSQKGDLRFIEYNPDPGAVANYFKLSRIFGAMPIMKEFAKRYPIRKTLTWVSVAWELAGLAGRLLAGRGLTVIVSGQEPHDALSRQLELEVGVARSVMRTLGLRMDVVHAAALTFRGDQVFHGRRKVTFAFVTDWDRLLRAFSPLEHPFWRATASGNLCVVSSCASKILRGNKAVFALLSDPQYRAMFDRDVADALDAHIPSTRLVRQGWTTWADQKVDLVAFMRMHREELVIKPATSQGGKGVVLGWLSSDGEWSAAIDRALTTTHVVQQRVEDRRERYPTAVDGQFAVREYATDFNVFIWNTTTVRGYMARVSEGALMNVTAGSGSLTPVFSIRLGPN